jgi:malonyl-CoA decarboxylase
MPDEPLIFVEVALVNGLAGTCNACSMRAPTHDARQANTAIFYSINNWPAGAGRHQLRHPDQAAADQLAKDLPNIKDFATLAHPRPAPAHRRTAEERGRRALTAAEIATLVPVISEGAAACASCRPAKLVEVPAINKALRPILTRLAARYLTTDENGRALDRVAHFHLGNGAVVERLNWLADTSANGFKQSYAGDGELPLQAG